MLPILIGIIFVAAGLARLGQLGQGWLALRTWQVVVGEVTRAELVRVSPRDEPDAIARYEPILIYTYTVDGKHYRGELTDEDIGLVKHTQGQQLMADFAVGNPISIHYLPAAPWESKVNLYGAGSTRQFFYAGASVVAGVILVLVGLA